MRRELIYENAKSEAEQYAASCKGVNHRKTAAADFLRGVQYAIDHMDGWVSVEDALPPLNHDVVAKKDGCWITVARRMNMNEESATKTIIRWVAGNSVRDWDVTHWMELP